MDLDAKPSSPLIRSVTLGMEVLVRVAPECTEAMAPTTALGCARHGWSDTCRRALLCVTGTCGRQGVARSLPSLQVTETALLTVLPFPNVGEALQIPQKVLALSSVLTEMGMHRIFEVSTVLF